MQAPHVSAVGEVWTERGTSGLVRRHRGCVYDGGGAEGSKSGHLGLCVALPFIGQVPLGELLKLRV